MEMAGIVCYTGANIITEAREIVEQIGLVFFTCIFEYWDSGIVRNSQLYFCDPSSSYHSHLDLFPAVFNLHVREN